MNIRDYGSSAASKQLTNEKGVLSTFLGPEFEFKGTQENELFPFVLCYLIYLKTS